MFCSVRFSCIGPRLGVATTPLLRRLAQPVLFLFATALLFGCSGDSSSSSSAASDSGVISMTVDPETLEVGTLAFVRLTFADLEFDDIDVHGMMVKLVLPDSLEFVPGSAALITPRRVQVLDPVYWDEVAEDDSDSVAEELGESNLMYLIFSLGEEELGEETSGSLQFDVRGVERDQSAVIRVDLDRGTGTDFDPLNPAFDVEAEVGVSVVSEEDD